MHYEVLPRSENARARVLGARKDFVVHCSQHKRKDSHRKSPNTVRAHAFPLSRRHGTPKSTTIKAARNVTRRMTHNIAHASTTQMIAFLVGTESTDVKARSHALAVNVKRAATLPCDNLLATSVGASCPASAMTSAHLLPIVRTCRIAGATAAPRNSGTASSGQMSGRRCLKARCPARA